MSYLRNASVGHLLKAIGWEVVFMEADDIQRTMVETWLTNIQTLGAFQAILACVWVSRRGGFCFQSKRLSRRGMVGFFRCVKDGMDAITRRRLKGFLSEMITIVQSFFWVTVTVTANPIFFWLIYLFPSKGIFMSWISCATKTFRFVNVTRWWSFFWHSGYHIGTRRLKVLRTNQKNERSEVLRNILETVHYTNWMSRFFLDDPRWRLTHDDHVDRFIILLLHSVRS